MPLLSCCGIQALFSPARAPVEPVAELSVCSGCGCITTELGGSRKGPPKCQHCLRKEDEELLGPSGEEQRRLDAVAGVLDVVSWNHFKPGEQPAQVLDWLYLGDLKEALDLDLLKSKGINAVLNVMNWWQLCSTLPEYYEGLADFYADNMDFEMVETEDCMSFDLVGSKWGEVEAVLEQWRRAGKTVLINCKAGHNRSACFCVCWLMVHERMSLPLALQHVLSVRGSVLSNNGFRLQLVRLAQDLEQEDLGRDPDHDSEKEDVRSDFVSQICAEESALQVQELDGLVRGIAAVSVDESAN